MGLIGVRRRGNDLARRLMGLLEARGVGEVAFGTLDITLYRDDLAEIGPSAVVRTTEIDFDVSGRYIVLVDDVIYTGRSVRSALAAIIDLGRPKAIRLAVLINRGQRELPIRADYVGKMLQTSQDEFVKVRLEEEDGVDEIYLGAIPKPAKTHG